MAPEILSTQCLRLRWSDFLQAFFRLSSLILPALYQLLLHRVLDRILWVRARAFLYRQYCPLTAFSKLKHLFQACQVPFDCSWERHLQESVVYARTSHVGFAAAAQLFSDQQVKLHIDVNSFGTGNLFRCAEGELRTMRMNRP